jgi:tetratricopeptide (TPR) repeat protein
MNAARVLKVLSILSLVLLTSCTSSAYRHTKTGNRLFNQQKYQESLFEYRQAQVNNPDMAEPFYNASNVYNRLGELDAVQTQTLQTLEKAEPGLAALAWYNLGNAFFDAQNFSAAVEAYKEALRLTPDDLDAKHNLELALLMEEKQDEEKEQQQPSQADSGEDQPTPTPGEKPDSNEPEEVRESQESPESSETIENSNGIGELTPEQAAQLLEVLLSDSPTLQEYLNQVHDAPGPLPREDW